MGWAKFAYSIGKDGSIADGTCAGIRLASSPESPAIVTDAPDPQLQPVRKLSDIQKQQQHTNFGTRKEMLCNKKNVWNGAWRQLVATVAPPMNKFIAWEFDFLNCKIRLFRKQYYLPYGRSPLWGASTLCFSLSLSSKCRLLDEFDVVNSIPWRCSSTRSHDCCTDTLLGTFQLAVNLMFCSFIFTCEQKLHSNSRISWCRNDAKLRENCACLTTKEKDWEMEALRSFDVTSSCSQICIFYTSSKSIILANGHSDRA